MTDDSMLDDETYEEELACRRAKRNGIILLAGTLLIVAGIGSYLAWCPEAPRFSRRPWRKQWWQRQYYHLRH